MREYEFELSLCAHLERSTEGIVARQLGASVHATAGRVLDTVVVTPSAAFERRRAITAETIPPLAIECSVGPGRATRWPGAVDLHPETARGVLERAVDVGFFERERRSGRTYVRQAVRYPIWFDEIIAIENKPTLDRPGALIEQLQYDVSLGLVDRVILATGSYVTRAHLNRIPAPVGVWRVEVDSEDVTVEEVRAPQALAVDERGTEVLDRAAGRTDVRTVSPAEKTRVRTRIAERAYGKGWRPAFPACARVQSTARAGTQSVPHCAWKDRVVDPGGCGPDCPGYASAPAPAVDHDAARAARTPWEPDPDGVVRTQVDLDRFGSESDHDS